MQLKVTYIELPTEEQREDVRKSVNATAESLKRDVQHLIEWLEKQPHLPNYRDENVLEKCLIQCKNSLERTKVRLEKYFSSKALYPEVYQNRNPFEKEIERLKNFGLYVPLRKLTPDGYRVACLYLSDDMKTASEFPPVDDFFKLNIMAIELMGKLDYVKGAILIHDGKNVNMSLVKMFSSHIQKMLLLLYKAMPIRYPKIYCVNFGRTSEIFLAITKPLLKKKIVKRIKILKKPTDICNVLPKKIIPRELGGDELSMSELKDLWYEDIKNNYDYLHLIESFTADMTKVPKDFFTTELSGMVGSFKQLSVD